MKTSLSPQLGQSLRLTPQLLQTIRLLQLTAPQLEQELRQELDRNPLLEEDEPAAAEASPCNDDASQPAGETAAWDELPEPMFLSGVVASGDDDATARIAAGESSDPRQRLLALLQLQWTPRDLGIAAFWLDHVDDRGYLEEDAATLRTRGADALALPERELEYVRQRLLHGEWPGVAAADLRECLQAQLQLMTGPQCDLAARILDHHIDLLAAHDHAAMATALGATADEVHGAVALIVSLRPCPIQAETTPDAIVVPDVVAWRGDGRWHVALNASAFPRVRISAHCEQALAQTRGDNTVLRGMLEDARRMVRGVAMRNETLLRTAQVLADRQRGFLEHGDEALAPLLLREVADAIGMHESTVSRIVNGKYIQTPRGTFELKRLFAVRLEGARIGASAIKAIVKRLIDSEPANAPLADDVIAGMLARQGVRIARRTVAKYRDQLDIGPANVRRAKPAHTSPSHAIA